MSFKEWRRSYVGKILYVYNLTLFWYLYQTSNTFYRVCLFATRLITWSSCALRTHHSYDTDWVDILNTISEMHWLKFDKSQTEQFINIPRYCLCFWLLLIPIKCFLFVLKVNIFLVLLKKPWQLKIYIFLKN